MKSLIQGPKPVEFSGGKEFELEKNDDDTLRQIIISDYFSFRNELILEMDNNYSLGNYNIALLQAVMRFENFIYSNLPKIKDISKTQINKLKKKDCGCLVGISELITRGFNELFNIDFEKTKEFENLKDYALGIRNKIVHGEIDYDIGSEKCLQGILAVKEAEIYLINNVFTHLIPNLKK